MHDDQKVLYGLYMAVTGLAPFDGNASTFVKTALSTDAIDYIDDHEDNGFYVTIGRFTEVSRYWEHVLGQLKIAKGTATTSETHTVATGTSMSSTHTQEVASQWSVETGHSVTASAGLDIPFISSSIAGEMSRAEKNSGSNTRTTSREVGMTRSQQITHTFVFEGPVGNEPDPIDLAWWQLVQVARLGDVFWFSAGPLDSDAMCPPPAGTLEIDFPRAPMSQGGWCELVQKFDIFELTRG
ncbi:hypothetical protein [Roseospira navarrensis]|uniref:Uncharacterized protein n=1 Tax=Roseospira navarrensis TaxID=140058 RepID=A0A7X1ZHJ6_9PROT|nr:hypothetical protein [Roseospira navarrensis]MQX38502.1 hypothetical protein [Roseospira navarrensis]